MRYDPTQATESSGQDFKPGVYLFTVATAEEGISQNGNMQIKLVLAVNITSDGAPVTVYDYLVNTPGGLWKTKLFCKETGLDFDSGEITDQLCVGRGGRVELGYDNKDLAAKRVDPSKKIYLKVKRYGIHQDKADAPAVAQSPVSNDGAPPITDADVSADVNESPEIYPF